MDLFLDILLKVTLPIVALVALGFALQPRLHLDVIGLNRLQVFVVLPCFLLHHLSAADVPIAAVWPTVYFSLLQFALLMALGWGAAALFRVERSLVPVLAMATVYANVGFFGIPLVQLAFPPQYILHQSVITSLITIVMVTVGVWLLAPARGGAGPLGRVRQAFETPVIPAVVAGLLLRAAEIKLPPVFGTPIQMMGSIFTPLALYTLGAQLAGGKYELRAGPLALVLVLKLLVAPAATWALALALGMPQGLTELFVVGAATPVGVLLAIYCAELDRHPGFVAGAVLVSTALSPLVVTGWILATRLA
jgi:predicted permease